MKTLNKIAFIAFGALSLLAGIFAIAGKRIDLMCLCVILGGISYACWQDIKHPE